MELYLAEISDNAESMPRAVTLTLMASLAQLAGEPANEAAIDNLCVADRQFLMRELVCVMGQERTWYSSNCKRCATRFDFHIEYAELPLRAAGRDYPYAQVKIEDEPFTFRLPTGADQIRLFSLPTEQRQDNLLRNLVVDREVEAAWVGGLLPETVTTIDEALEATSPALVLEVAACCPDCGEVNSVALNPYEALFRSSIELLGEVHRIAMHYHWGEAEILALPRARRQSYLRLIDAARGMMR